MASHGFGLGFSAASGPAQSALNLVSEVAFRSGLKWLIAAGLVTVVVVWVFKAVRSTIF